MGNYTELVLAVDLLQDVPDTVIDTLKYMLDHERTDEYIPPFDHPLFCTERWRVMLISDSASFAGGTHTHLDKDSFTDQYRLSVRCNLKNYNGEIQKFLEWIMPFTVFLKVSWSIPVDGFIR